MVRILTPEEACTVDSGSQNVVDDGQGEKKGYECERSADPLVGGSNSDTPKWHLISFPSSATSIPPHAVRYGSYESIEPEGQIRHLLGKLYTLYYPAILTNFLTDPLDGEILYVLYQVMFSYFIV
jgi:hypothetical protein